jgi:hypothetical protein
VGWGCGILATIGGLMLSYGMDWPPAPAISCIFAAILIGSGIVFSVRRSPRPALALARFAGGAVALCAVGFGLAAFLRAGHAQHELAENEAHAAEQAVVAPAPEHSHGTPEHGLGASRQDLLTALADEHENVRASAAEQLGKSGDAAVIPALTKALQDPADAVKEKAAEALGALGRAESVPALEAALAQKGQDEWVQLRQAVALVRCGGPKGMTALIGLAKDADAQLVRSQALQQACAFAGQPPPAPTDSGAQQALQQLETWWAANGPQARWDAATGRFSGAPSR